MGRSSYDIRGTRYILYIVYYIPHIYCTSWIYTSSGSILPGALWVIMIYDSITYTVRRTLYVEQCTAYTVRRTHRWRNFSEVLLSKVHSIKLPNHQRFTDTFTTQYGDIWQCREILTIEHLLFTRYTYEWIVLTNSLNSFIRTTYEFSVI